MAELRSRWILAAVAVLLLSAEPVLGCLGESTPVLTLEGKRLVSAARITEYTLSFDGRIPKFSQLALIQHLTDSHPRQVVLISFSVEEHTLQLSLTPNHYVLNATKELMRADEFDVGDKLWFMNSNSAQPRLVPITAIQSRCERVANVVLMEDYVVANGVIVSCFLSLQWLGVDMLEVKWLLVPARFLFQLGLNTLCQLVDKQLLQLNFSLCGPVCP